MGRLSAAPMADPGLEYVRAYLVIMKLQTDNVEVDEGLSRSSIGGVVNKKEIVTDDPMEHVERFLHEWQVCQIFQSALRIPTYDLSHRLS